MRCTRGLIKGMQVQALVAERALHRPFTLGTSDIVAPAGSRTGETRGVALRELRGP